MTETKTVTEQTVHGSIEYEVVECDSCGQDVIETEANDFTIGSRDGHACDMCVHEGPSSFPPSETEEPTASIAVLSVPFPLSVIALVAVVADEGWCNETIAFAAGSLGASMWIGAYLWAIGVIA